MRGDFDCVQN
jgi:DNA-directed RNA polymerase I subunit RPA1